jgi:hypothetical protein
MPELAVPESCRRELIMTPDITAILSAAEFIALRYETPYTPCTGITAVVRQELRAFRDRGVVVAPWSSRMAAAQKAFTNGAVVDTGVSLPVAQRERTISVRVLCAGAPEAAPVLYLAADGYFEGAQSPYDTPTLAQDAVFFGQATCALLAGRVGNPFIWGADWQTVPALALCDRYTTAITLHNMFDEWLAESVDVDAEPVLQRFRHQTALQVALDMCDVVTTVNRGYALGLRTEVFHRFVMARHVQTYVGRIVGIDNANFVDPGPDHIKLAKLLGDDSGAGVSALTEMQQKALQALPPGLRQLANGKVLCVAMGRRSVQKLHCVVADAVRRVLRQDPSAPLFVLFATTHSDESSPARLERIKSVCAEFPANAAWSDGRIDYFPALMSAASFNILCSLWAPHEGAFESTIVPIARAVDGLAAQVCPLNRRGTAGALADRWHAPSAEPNGLTFRELAADDMQDREDLMAVMNQSPVPLNPFVERLTESLADAIREAITMRTTEPVTYGRLVRGTIRTQLKRSWDINLGGMLALVEAARRGRT